ncbi:STAS domain-containing protein [Achromobacter marplatensis]|uniref:STAS domain-containing protein n=1 Tax=Achromobacter marplatensis TaxID=470868 RepID=UPI0039F69FD0
MNLATEQVGDTLVVGVPGHINSGNAAELEAELMLKLEQRPARLVLDLADLSYISSAGLRVVLVLAKKVRESGGILIVCGLSGAVHEVFDVSGFLEILTVRKDRICALSVDAIHQADAGK